MAATVKYGSKGDDVVALQNALNQQGYGLDADGIFGDKTLAAVKQYQQANGLSVDGIVGANTWGALTGGGGSSTGGSGSASGSYTTYNPSYTLDSLMADLEKQNYTRLTDEQITQQAKNKYDPIYNKDKLSAQQAHDKNQLALDQQLAKLAPIYAKQREESQKAYDQAYSQADRQSLSRGMQRSSYTGQTLANIDLAGAKAQDAIGEAQTLAESEIEQNRVLASQQLNEYIRQLEMDYATNISAYEDAIRDKDYDRATAALQYNNQLAMYLEEASRQQAQWQAEFSENQRQFDTSLAASKSSGGSSNSNNKPATDKKEYSVDDLAEALNGNMGTGSDVLVRSLALGAYASTKDWDPKKKKTTPTGGGGGYLLERF